MIRQNNRIAVWVVIVLLIAPLAPGASGFRAVLADPAEDLASGRSLGAVFQAGPSAALDVQGVSSDWWATVQEDIRQAEYNITWQELTYLADVPAAYQAPNRAHNLRTYFTPAGPIVIPRTWANETDTPPWRIEIALAGWGRTGVYAPVQLPTLEPGQAPGSTNLIHYRRDQLVEWYRNNENGLEQGFTLSSPPSQGEGPLQLDLAIRGDLAVQLNSAGTAIELQDSKHTPLLSFGGLAALDADGQTLPARLSWDGAAFSLHIDDTGAVYPITVTLLLTVLPSDPDWQFNFAWAGSDFGASVATAGDVNADGYSDVIVGIPNWDGGQNSEGRAFVFLGSSTGLLDYASWDRQSDEAHALYGTSVSTAGDVDGDGDSEVIVGAPGWDPGGGAWVYYGSPGGLSLTAEDTYQEVYAGSSLGISVATAGDVNGDSYADIIIGEYWYDTDFADGGRVVVAYGSASGLSDGWNWTAHADQLQGQLGYSVGTAGDVNGDGYSDIIVGAPYFNFGSDDEGKVFVWYGSEDGPNLGVTGTMDNADWTAQGDQVQAWCGWSVSTAGDVNGDGYSDVIVGLPGYTNGEGNEGAARLYLGSSSGLNNSYDNHDEGNQVGAAFGGSVSTAGDVNGDGYADVMVGASIYSNGESEEGSVFLWLGSADGISTTRDWSDEGNVANAHFGSSIATAGDVNGDGYSEVIIGVPGRGSNAGSAYAYYGGPDSLEETASWTKDSDQANAHFGQSVASAGDVDADGYTDVIVGAPHWDNGQAVEGGAWIYLGDGDGLETVPDWHKESDQANALYGWSVSTAGDVNGDGYDDIIVGSPGYASDLVNEGMAWVYLGSSSGTELEPDWYKDSDHTGAQFGYSVGTAGDVNGDGYADVIVGAPFYSSPESSEGVASVYHGTPDGLHIVPDWHAEIDQTNALFSTAVGTAGDINGDGYADVIVGAPNWTNGSTSEGGAWVYLGSGSGLSLTYRWHQEGDRYDATYGASVGAAGDVNGDGYSDIIIGAPRWSNGQATEGKAFVYHSTGSNLSLTPAWTKESDTASTQFGYSVSTAGDVNGDGYADIIVGAYGWHDEGGAFLYQGTSTGLHIVPDWHAGGGQIGVRFGYAVAGAGDVNGDGYADVVVGAPWYEDLFAQEGRAFLFYGNASRGVPLRMRQLNESGETIAHLGKAKTDHFRVYVLRPSPFGSGEIKIELEAKPLGQRFDGTNTRIPLLWNKPTFGSGAYIGSPDVTPGTPYHWRLRLLYNPATTPFMPASRWVTIPWNGWNEADLRTSGSRLFLPLVLRND